MAKFGKIAAASFNVMKEDFENYLSEVMEDLGLNKLCKGDEQALEKLEEKREKVIKKVNKFFDSLKDELQKDESKSEDKKSDGKLHDEILLSIKEIRHQLSQMQGDINELKGKS